MTTDVSRFGWLSRADDLRMKTAGVQLDTRTILAMSPDEEIDEASYVSFLRSPDERA